MKTEQDDFKSKVPIVIIDPSLEQYRNKVLFPKQLAMAEEMLKTAKLPKSNYLGKRDKSV